MPTRAEITTPYKDKYVYFDTIDKETKDSRLIFKVLCIKMLTMVFVPEYYFGLELKRKIFDILCNRLH